MSYAFDEGYDARSLASSMTRAPMLNANNVFYQTVVKAVDTRLTELLGERVQARAGAPKVIATVSLSPAQQAWLSSLFPEYVIAYVPMTKPGHALWVQTRRVANEWLACRAEHFGGNYIHLGGSLLDTLVGGHKGAHLEYDELNVVAEHERYSVSSVAYQVYGNYYQVATHLGVDMHRGMYDAYLRGDAFHPCEDSAVCTHTAPIMCVDLSVHALAPQQVAAAMAQADADIAIGFLPYHSDMLLTSSGELPEVGVRFRYQGDSVEFVFPEGSAGVESYSYVSWAQWLVSHVFVCGADSFSLELMENRGPFLFWTLTRVRGRVDGLDVDVRHALELRDASTSYYVQTPRLRALGLDVSVDASWEVIGFFVDKSLVDRVYNYCMQAPRESFARHMVKRQLQVVNDRVIIQGSAVEVRTPLTPERLEELTTAIFLRAFVDRYDSGRLSSAMMAQLKQVQAFTSLSGSERLLVLGVYALRTAWNAIILPLEEMVKGFCTWLTQWFKVNVAVPKFSAVPAYFQVSAATSHLVGHPRELMKTIEALMPAEGVVVTPTLRGASLLSQVRVRVGEFLAKPDKLLHVYRSELIELSDIDTAELNTDEERAAAEAVSSVYPFEQGPAARHFYEVHQAMNTLPRADDDVVLGEVHDPNPVASLNAVYDEAIPGVSLQQQEYDPASLSFSHQDRSLSALYMRLPRYYGEGPRPRDVYESKVRALNVAKRQSVVADLVSSVAARNLSAPVVSLPQDRDVVIKEIWENFLDNACMPDAREKLLGFQSDPVAGDVKTFADWNNRAKPGQLASVVRELQEATEYLDQHGVESYMMMMKSDVKPTLSVKPMSQHTAPQVIVYHDKLTTHLYSCIFRVLVRRLLSVLKPNVNVVLLKDADDTLRTIQSMQPWPLYEGHAPDVQYLENDFSKYDKSQGEFVFALEEYVFRQLGMNQAFLDHWVRGHTKCKVRALAMGVSLYVMHQRKSGDASTAFGNVLLSVLSVFYAYGLKEFYWACFMGDDSLVAVPKKPPNATAVAILREVFNLSAKMYITSAPYLFSNFVLVDNVRHTVTLLPDPIKKVEKLSMSVPADDPKWEERYESFKVVMQPYRRSADARLFAACVALRYDVESTSAAMLLPALRTIMSSFASFRAVWEDKSVRIEYA